MNLDHGIPGLLASGPLSEEFQFRALMDNTDDSIYFKDRDCRLIGVSLRMARNLGFTDPLELIGKTDIDLFGESFGSRTFLEDLRIMESNEPIIGLVGEPPDGRRGIELDLDDQGARP